MMAASVVTIWPPRAVIEVSQRLNELKNLVGSPREETSQEARDWLARLLVVRSCGFIEQIVLEVCRGYLDQRSGGPARSFSSSWLERGRNPTPDALVTFVGRFDAAWSAELRELLDENDERLGRELAFLVDRRNKIAHGLNEGIGAVKAIQLSEVSGEISDWFVARFNPDRR
jgi:hypothetical protein